jgi:hypothetical protein
MNIIEEIKTIRSQVDFIVNHLKGDETEMLDPNILHTELSKAQSLISRSKSAIQSLQAKIAQHEATIAAHLQETDAAKAVETTVSDIASKFTASFQEFEDFLTGVTSNTAPVVANTVTATPVANVAVVVPPTPVVAPVTPAVPDPVPAANVAPQPTVIGPLAS